MTANQIAAASEREAERHNQVSEEEIQRHNEATEELEKRRLTFEEDYKRDALYIDQQLREAQLKLERTKEEDRVMLESWVNTLQEQKNDIQRYYNGIFYDIEQEKNALQANWNEFLKTHYGKQLDFEDKRLEYQKYQWDTENWLSFLDYGMQIKKFEEYQAQNQRDYQINLGRLDLQSLGLSQEMTRFQENLAWQQSQFAKQQYLSYMEYDLNKERNDAQIALWGSQQDLINAQNTQTKWNTGFGIADFFNPFSKRNQNDSILKATNLGLQFLGGM